jgi:c-di-GMP-related signal transduction protein
MDHIPLLPTYQSGVEIRESVEPDDLTIAACQRLKEAGYMVALDDFDINDPREVLTDFPDIVKVDRKNTPPKRQADLIKEHSPGQCRMLAEKVEIRQEFFTVRKAGFVYFKGSFFSQPEILSPTKFPPID